MVQIRDADNAVEVTFVISALIAPDLVLRLAAAISHVLGTTGIVLVSRVVGVLLVAIAVQVVATGIERWVQAGV